MVTLRLAISTFDKLGAGHPLSPLSDGEYPLYLMIAEQTNIKRLSSSAWQISTQGLLYGRGGPTLKGHGKSRKRMNS